MGLFFSNVYLKKTEKYRVQDLVDIIKGEMSFIGPRPWVTDYAKYFTKEQMKRL